MSARSVAVNGKGGALVRQEMLLQGWRAPAGRPDEGIFITGCYYPLGEEADRLYQRLRESDDQGLDPSWRILPGGLARLLEEGTIRRLRASFQWSAVSLGRVSGPLTAETGTSLQEAEREPVPSWVVLHGPQ